MERISIDSRELTRTYSNAEVLGNPKLPKIGTRIKTEDGREFVFSKTTATLLRGEACSYPAESSAYISGAPLSLLDNSATLRLGVNYEAGELAGSFLWHPCGDGDNVSPQLLEIVGNGKGVSSAAIDYPWETMQYEHKILLKPANFDISGNDRYAETVTVELADGTVFPFRIAGISAGYATYSCMVDGTIYYLKYNLLVNSWEITDELLSLLYSVISTATLVPTTGWAVDNGTSTVSSVLVLDKVYYYYSTALIPSDNTSIVVPDDEKRFAGIVLANITADADGVYFWRQVSGTAFVTSAALGTVGDSVYINGTVISATAGTANNPIGHTVRPASNGYGLVHLRS